MNKIIKFFLVMLISYVIILFLWIVFFRKIDESFEKSVGTRWAVLLAGSKGYHNYRHQADVCHAYQIFKNGGLKDENIVVFMYDDLAFHEENPRKGIIINSPAGADVYHGVPKDYTGEDVTVGNFLAALLGNKNAVKGGSGKVVDSGPNDRIFVYYSGHGAYGLVTMPTKPFMYANDLIEVLKKKHAAGSYKGLVFYLEACKSGSIFQGLLPLGLDIYATTACNTHENSYATYCPGVDSSLSDEYTTCLGDLYSITWMEDCDVHNLKTETLKQQYRLVKKRASNSRSHVMEYGDLQISMDKLYSYFGTNPANENFTFIESNTQRPSLNAVNQWDADLLHFSLKCQKAPEGSDRKIECKKQLAELLAHRKNIDASFKLLEKVLSGLEKGPEVLNVVRPTGKPLVDDWDCLKTFVRTFETHCGSLSEYGMKHMRSIANFCNARITKEQMIEASSQACPICPSNSWSSNCNGFSA